MNVSLRRVVDTVSALVALAAVALLFWPARSGEDAERAHQLFSVSTIARASYVADSTTAQIVSGNLFSSSRRAPKSRFLPPGSEPSGATMAGAAVDAYPAPVMSAGTGTDSGIGAEAGNADRVPALYGVVSVDGVRRALLSLRAGESPRLFEVGDRHAGYRVSAIESDRVVLVTAGGLRTLRLTPPASRDSSENLP